MISSDGHTCLKSTKANEAVSGDFRVVLSYNELSESIGQFVVHISTQTFDYSPYIQRFEMLERLGFRPGKVCPHMDPYECRCYVLGTVSRDRMQMQIMAAQPYHDMFKKLADNLQNIFGKTRELDQVLKNAGFSLPYEGAELVVPPATASKEKAYLAGEQYDLWKDVNANVKLAKSDVFVVDPYADESLFELYLQDAPSGVNVRILVNQPKGKLDKVAELFSRKRPIQLRSNSDVHDRHLFVDNRGWVIGSSIKDAAAKKPTYMIELTGVGVFRSIYDGFFNNGKVIV